MPIHKMVDDIFKHVSDDIIDEIAEERTFIKNYLKDLLNDNDVWTNLAESKENRKDFLSHLQILFLNEMENSALIELATISGDDIKP